MDICIRTYVRTCMQASGLFLKFINAIPDLLQAVVVYSNAARVYVVRTRVHFLSNFLVKNIFVVQITRRKK